MTQTFVFNGDADGLCALQQLFLVEKFTNPALVTGVKRHTDLLRMVEAGRGDHVTVLDVSFKTNAEDVRRLLAAGAHVRYFDHHHCGDLTEHPALEAHIDLASDTCTSAIVDRYLRGAARLWAVVGAFGDNLERTARTLAALYGLGPAHTAMLERLGVALNYNSYGETEADLLFHPLELHRRMKRYRDPRAFAASEDAFQALCDMYDQDIANASSAAAEAASESAALYVLPNAAWARRVSGVFANLLVQREPRRAHAVAVPAADGTLTISVRAALERPHGAAALCLQFPSGGGRERAAGINNYPASELDRFATAFMDHFQSAA